MSNALARAAASAAALGAAAVFTTVSPAAGQEAIPLRSGTAITEVAVIDTRTGAILPNRTVVIDRGRITAVAPATNARLGAGVTRVSGSGKFLIPGLWDMHVHLSPMLGGPDILPVFTAYGVTGVRDAGSQDSIYPWRRQVALGERVGPRIVAAGGMLVSYVTAADVGSGGSVTAVQSVGEARTAVRARRGKAQYLKLQDSFLPRAIWLAAADEAAKEGLPVAGHVPMGLGLADAIAAGLRDIEHVIGLSVAVVPGEADRRHRIMARARPPGLAHADIMAGYAALFEIEAETWKVPADSSWRHIADLMARHGVALDPGLTDLRALATAGTGRWNDDPRLAYLPPATRADWFGQVRGALFSAENTRRAQQMLAPLFKIVGDLHRRGVTILAGTDAGSPFDFPGSDIHSELVLLVEAGLSPLAALQAATLNPARFMGLADTLGTIEVGKLADLVLLEGNPLTDVHQSRRIAGVIQAGRYFSRGALDSLLASAKEKYATKTGQ